MRRWRGLPTEMFEPATVKLLLAIALFSAPVIFASDVLTKRDVLGRRLNRAQAQALGAVVGLVLGVGFLLAAG